MARIRWTKEEDEIIVNALEVYMNAKKPFSQAFEELTKFLPNRTAVAIAAHWKNDLKDLHPKIKSKAGRGGSSSEWTEDEDITVAIQVIDKISNGGVVNDAVEELCELFPNRTALAIKTRWTGQLRQKFAEEYKEARAKRKQLRKSQAEQQTLQLSEELKVIDDSIEIIQNVVRKVNEETITRRLGLADNKVESEPVVKTLAVDEPKEEKVDPVDLQETKHLTNFLDNVTGMIEERDALRQENLSLRQQNQRLNIRIKEKDEELEKLETKYRDVILMISKVQELMGEQSASMESLDELHSIKLKMERNGNLIRVQ